LACANIIAEVSGFCRNRLSCFELLLLRKRFVVRRKI
jgi:hypothetical protein